MAPVVPATGVSPWKASRESSCRRQPAKLIPLFPPSAFEGTGMPPPRVEWVRISSGRRVAYGLLAVVMLLVFALVAWLDLQARRTGALDMGIMGGTLAGGAVLAFSAITGKERRKVV